MTPPPPTTTSHFALLHEIFVLDAVLRHPLDSTNKKLTTKHLIDDLLTALRMEALGPLGVFPATDKRAPGWSFIQPITTSHISGHYFEAPGDPHIRIDVYSCASVNWRKVIIIAHKHLNMREWRATFIDRQIGNDGAERLIIDISGYGDEVHTEHKLSIDNQRNIQSNKQIPALSIL